MDAILEVVRREGRRKNEANRLRASGKIPAVFYGPGKSGKAKDAVAVSVDPKAVMRILHSDSGANTLINLKLDGSETRVMLREYQLDPVTHHLLHADFYELAMDKAITVSVPVLVKGEPAGVKQQGGLLDFVTREIEVECLPTDIPEHIDIDVSELMLHQSIRVRDLPEHPKWKAVSEPDTMLVHIVVPKAEEEPAAATAEAVAGAVTAAPAEPEVIKKGKTDEKVEEEKKEKK
jgi:large subunit ribosomal protein L25